MSLADILRPTDLMALEAEYGARNYKPLDVVLTRGEGVYLWDVDGRRYLDCLSAYSAVNQGHCHPRILEAMVAQAQRLTLTSRAFRNDQLGLFYEEVCTLTHSHSVLPMNTGVEAVESGLKVARKWGYEVKGVPADQAEIIVCDGNFHGRTLGVVAFSTDPLSYAGFGPFAPGFKIVPYGDAKALEQAIGPNTVALLVEPIQGEADDAVAARGKSPLQGLCGPRHDDGPIQRHRVDAEAFGVGAGRLDQQRGGNDVAQPAQRLWRQGRRIVEDLPARQRAEAGVQVIVARAGQRQAHHLATEMPGDDRRGVRAGARALPRPEQTAAGVPDAVAGAFLEGLDLGHMVERALGSQRLEGGEKPRLLAAALRMAEARDQGHAVEYDGGIGREDHVGLAGEAGQNADARALGLDGVFQPGPGRQGGAAVAGRSGAPDVRPHPGIDLIAHPIVGRIGHQKLGGHLSLPGTVPGMPAGAANE